MRALRALASVLVKSAMAPATVYLFGSYARGDATSRSDVDILVVERGLGDWLAETVRLGRIVRAHLDKEVDLVVMGAVDWRKWRHHQGTIQHAAATEGVRLAG
jgi:predicted nucleotidyltransferase